MISKEIPVQKKSYVKPALLAYGNVQMLTQSKGSTSVPDGGQTAGFMMSLI